ENYILHYANLADSLQVPLFCIGTEFRMAVQKRGPFWKNLIKKVRAIYSGQITYAANWDNYQLIDFWSELDYIGIDAYFPLIEVAQPTLSQLLTAWGPEFERLKSLSADYQKPILFTEFGYQSLTGTTGKHWQLNNKNTEMESQRTAYEAILNKFWDVPWFAGGFLWKWHLKKDAGGLKDPNFTPQGKPALEVITKYYKSHTRHSVAIK
ncbi:MAG: hypothetical protein HQ474_09935, partial [Flammeovirgaceae bacterium]|nr:hypothetical protein [Flammeovirgaceae bacterium]